MISTHRTNIFVTAFLGLEAGLWGLVVFLHLLFVAQAVRVTAIQLAIPLALILAGLSAFGLAWRQAQRLAHSDPDERFHPVRAEFLYTLLLATSLPAAISGLFVLRDLLGWLWIQGEFPLTANTGLLQVNPLLPFVVNGLATAYVFWVIRSDWKAGPSGEGYLSARRWFRYAWLIWSVVVSALGLQQTLQGAGQWVGAKGEPPQMLLLNGLAFLAVGIPLWRYLRRTIQRSLGDSVERLSLVRLAALGVLSSIGLTGLILFGGILFSAVVRLALGYLPESQTWIEWITIPLSGVLPFAGVLFYYARQQRRVVKIVPDGPRKNEVQRAYAYVLLFIGVLSTAFGLQRLVEGLFIWWADPVALRGLLFDRADARGELLAALLGLGVGFMLIGLPLIVYAWRPLRRELKKEGESGELARHSLARRIYLWLGQLLGGVGLAVSLGELFLRGLDQLLGNLRGEFFLQNAQWLGWLTACAILLVFHGVMQRSDQMADAAALARRQAAYSVLLLTMEDENGSTKMSGFAGTLIHALHRQAPAVPVAVHPVSRGVPDEILSAARLVILPADLLVRPPEAIRLWLQAYPGLRLVIPIPTRGWHWAVPGSLPAFARLAARQVRRMAEGKEDRN